MKQKKRTHKLRAHLGYCVKHSCSYITFCEKCDFEFAQETTSALMALDNRIWDELGLVAGYSSDPTEKTVETCKTEYIKKVVEELTKMSITKEHKVSAAIRQKLEAENYHSLNMVLDESGLGEGNY